jgi:2-amino-4-hydroxy-6-hydroxymethyldihydropteridine diphosphokinase
LKPDSNLACLLLGSNIEPEVYLPRAVFELGRLLPIRVASQVWETAPVGSLGPAFLNLALLTQTHHNVASLKTELLQPLEERLGRVRQVNKYAPRTIDIDILTWGEQIVELGLWSYAHIAVPSSEILPDLKSPETGERLVDAARRLLDPIHIRLRSDITPEEMISSQLSTSTLAAIA